LSKLAAPWNVPKRQSVPDPHSFDAAVEQHVSAQVFPAQRPDRQS
jgi:hypothetical protein